MFSKTPCVIVSGGKSSRMGENKALLPFGSESSLILFQYKRLVKMFDRVYINAKDITFNFEYLHIEDLYKDIYSPANALYSVVKKLNEPFFVISVDTPFVNRDICKALYEKSQNKTLSTIASSDKKIHPLCALYTTDILPPLEDMLKNDMHKLQYMIKQIPHEIVEFNEEKYFFNLNTQSEYKEAKEILNKQI